MLISITGLLPIFKYNGTRMSEPAHLKSALLPSHPIISVQNSPNPNAKFGYETNPDATVGEILNSFEYIPMYTEGPRSAELPRKE